MIAIECAPARGPFWTRNQTALRGPNPLPTSEKFAKKSPYARASIKANVISAERLSLHDDIELESARHIRLISSRETKARICSRQKKNVN